MLVVDPGLGNATAQETISPDASATGLSAASSAGSAFRTGVVVVIVFIRMPFVQKEGPQAAGLPCIKSRGSYALTAPFDL